MNLFQRLKDVLFPPRCCVCDALVPRKSGSVCGKCAGRIIRPSTDPSRCDICFLPAEDCICGEFLYYDALAFLFYNEGEARKTLYKMKFAGRTDLAVGYGKLLARAVRERGLADKIDIVTCVPMSAYSQSERGYNQAELIARAAARELGKEFVPLLYKCRDGARQHDLGKTERTGNVLGAFEPFEDCEKMINGANVLVADDIITGGATANEAAKTLKIFGADNVYIAAAAATKNKKRDTAER